MIDVINAGSGRNTATEDKFREVHPAAQFDFGFAMGLMYKDVKLCLEEAEAAGVQMKIAAGGARALARRRTRSSARTRTSPRSSALERAAGVEVKGK